MARTRKYSYWEQRRARELYGLLVTAEESAEQLRQVYFMASRETEEEAIRIVRRFQLKNNLTEKEAFTLLEKVRDPADIKAVMKQLRKNPKNAALVAEAEAPAYAARIRQLQTVQKGVDQTALQLFQTTKAKTDETLEYVAKESYYREAFALDQQIGAAFPFGDLEPQDVQKILDTRWEGANYSERIWNSTQALADRVKREMLVSVLTGKTNEKIAREIANDFGVSFNAARRLVRTEACYVSNQIQMEIYKRTGVTEYIYSAILDMRTSPVCRSLDGKRFKVKKAQVGKNYPPMHPWCRSTTIAAMPESLLEKLKRTARDVFGKLIKVPASMAYEDWKQTTPMVPPQAVFPSSQNRELYEKYRLIFGDVFPSSFEDFLVLKYNNQASWESFKARKLDTLIQMQPEQMKGLKGKLGKAEVRAWYAHQDQLIPGAIDKTLPIKDQAKQAWGLRNRNRTFARDLMKDQVARMQLDKTDPNKSFKDLVTDKMKRKGLTQEEAYLDIIASAPKTRKSIDDKYLRY